LYWDSWNPSQLLLATGTSQLLVFGLRYLIPSTFLLLMWLVMLRRLVKTIGTVQLFATIPFQVWLLNVVAIALLPDQVMFPQFGLPLGFIAQRLSLTGAVILCAVLTAVPVGNLEKTGLVLVAVSFFALLYADDARLNELEDRIDSAVSQLTPAQRFIIRVSGNSLREMSVRHSLDRACIGRCYSYANYEPSSRQFRIRARPGNGIVLDDYRDVAAAERGSYVVQSRDLPLYALSLCGNDSREICTRQLETGAVDGQLNKSASKGDSGSR
jgi:hypothetical protein